MSGMPPQRITRLKDPRPQDPKTSYTRLPEEASVRQLVIVASVLVVGLGSLAEGQAPRSRLNPVIGLLEQQKAVFGLYAPSNRRFPGGQPPAAPEPPAKSPAELAQAALGYASSDFVFDGSMEGNFDRGYPSFAEFVKGMGQIGIVARTPTHRLHHPLIVKAPEIAPDPGVVGEQIGRQLNLGVSGVMFVSVESADEVRQGLAAMRFKSRGGTRAEDVGTAPALWGLSEAEYKAKADLWPLNPEGELINWTIVESKAGLAKVREIAAVKGIGVLWPGAGTLRQLFTTTDAGGQRKLDEAAWEAAIQQVLSACKEFNVPCGYPASEKDLELRMKQGFSVFVMNWGDAGFWTVELGRKLSGRTDTSR
jgi:4-hydroxy-2-oxoheptanedioate aldolase